MNMDLRRHLRNFRAGLIGFSLGSVICMLAIGTNPISLGILLAFFITMMLTDAVDIWNDLN